MQTKKTLWWICFVVLLAQNSYGASMFQIGHSQIALTDPSRENRPITAELYYPAVRAGEDVSVAAGTFPLIIFAHGYKQRYTHYHAIHEALVPQGYILLFPTTEQGLRVNIDDYAADLTFLSQNLRQQPLAGDFARIAGHLSSKLAYMGHSTGGGASYLAQAAQPLADTVITFAALGDLHGSISGKTNPTDAAATVTVPSLLLVGEKDCICPVDIHQQPIYDKLAAPTKVLITIISGDHCGFTDSKICSVAEFFHGGFARQGKAMDEDEQIQLSLRFLIPWLDYFLKGKQSAWPLFLAIIREERNKTSITFVPDDLE